MTSAKRYPRTARVNEVMLEVLADELERMGDPRLELVTLTGEVNALATHRLDSTRLVAAFDLQGRPAGLADVVLISGAQQSTLAGAFQIVAGGSAAFGNPPMPRASPTARGAFEVEGR